MKVRCSVLAIAMASLACLATGVWAADAFASPAASMRPIAIDGATPASHEGRAAGREIVVVATASLESVATKASETGRNVAMSLIGLALAIAAVVLAFKRDFKEAAAVFVVGLVCVLMATSAGVTLLQDTVNALVG